MATDTSQRERILDTWTNQPASTLDGAERHSQFVFIMRLTLPIVAVGIIAIVLIYSVAYKPNIQRVLDYPIIGVGTGAITMTEPRLTGMDVLDRYLEVSAERADRLPEDPDTVTLKTVDAKISKNGEMILHLESQLCHVYSRNNIIEFTDLVHIDLPDGYFFDTERTVVDMGKGLIKGETPLEGSGPLGEISADSFVVKQEEDIVQLKGNVHLRIDMSHMRELNKSSSQQNESASE